MTPTNINHFNALGESPLYRACVCGALLDVMTNHNDKMLYYPYRLPAGGPLHWAVAFSCLRATGALLRHGADPWLPNGVRQYIFSGGSTLFKPSSINDCVNEPPILGPEDGSCAVDLAVQTWDAGLVRLLLEHASRDTCVSANGIGTFHHLLAGEFRWISDVMQLYCPVFRGCPVTRRSRLRDTIHALLAFGFEIDSLCLAWVHTLWGPRTTCTSLMLAVYMANVEVVEALLRAGADVNMTGSGGQTALMDFGPSYTALTMEVYDYCKDLQRQMIHLLLAHVARVNHRANNGMSPILAMAKGHFTGAVEVLLENGAVINDAPTQRGSRQHHRLFPVLQDLAGSRWVNVRDSKVADMMRTYALAHLIQAAETKANSAQMSLLHTFALWGFFESACILLDTGLDINAMYDEVRNRKVVPSTPLDLLYVSWPTQIEAAKKKLPKSDVKDLESQLDRMCRLLLSRGACKASEL